MKNKYHTFFICMAFTSMALTGCDNEPPTISEQSKISIKESEKQNAIVADVSKDSLQLNTTFHFNGKSVTIPCRFSEFSNIELDTSMLIPANDNDVYGAIYKADERIGRVILKNFDIDDNDNVAVCLIFNGIDESELIEFTDYVVTYFELNPDIGFDKIDFTYQGFTHATSKEQIIDAFGTPDEEYSNNVCYHLKNDGYIEFEFIKEFSEIESIKIKSES